MSIKNNFYYSSILTAAGYFFPLITFPYVSRVLGVTNIGICNFVDSIINYFVLFSMMGIQTLGIREIANVKNDKEKLSEAFSCIVSLNLLFCIFFGTILLILIHLVPELYEHRNLMYIGVAKLISSLFLIEWLYKGLEQFRYITIRSILVRCLYVISIFLFVKSRNDYVIYYAIIIITELVNSLINCFHSRKYTKFHYSGLVLSNYFLPALILGVYSLLTTMYKSFNIVYLGFITNPTEVGYYTTSTKLHHIFLALFTAFSGVMLPRMSTLISEGKISEFRGKLNSSFSLLIYSTFPITVLGIIYASEIVTIISGKEFLKAACPLIILFPLVFIIGFEQILVHQILIPLKKDKAILINSIIGAIVGISSNLLLVKHYGCMGSAVVWTISEICVMFSAMYFTRQYFEIQRFAQQIIKNIIYAIPAIVICLLNYNFWDSKITAFVISSFLTVFYYFILYVFMLKDYVVISLLPQKILNLWK